MSNFNRLYNDQQFGRGRGRSRNQNYNHYQATRGCPSGQIAERTGNNVYVPKRVLRVAAGQGSITRSINTSTYAEVLGVAAGQGRINRNINTSTFAEGSSGWNMEGPSYSSWSDDDSESHTRGTGVFHPKLDLTDNKPVEQENEIIIPIDVLPDDLQQRIIASLPFISLFKVRCVSRKWNEIIGLETFTLNNEDALLRKPWYYMFTSSDERMSYVYDSGLGRWYNFELPFVVQHSWVVSSSCGLSCFMDEENGVDMYVCNLITGRYSILEKPSAPGFAVYTALAFSADRLKPDYNVIVIRGIQASEDFLKWDLTIHVYPSETKTWLPPVMGKMDGWRPGNVAVICNEVLYFLVYATRAGDGQHTHGVIAYDFKNHRCVEEAPIDLSPEGSIIYAPSPLTCGRLMNIKNKLVMVGGIARRDRPGIIRGVGIWVLEEGGWEKIGRMPNNIWQGFGEFDEVFASSGSGDLIYIQSYGGITLAVFNVMSKEWSWSHKCPMAKKFPLQIFAGFCFEPNLKVRP